MIRKHLYPLAALLFVTTAVMACGDDGTSVPTVTPDARPPGYCDGTIPCADAALPFCDVAGAYPASGGKPNTCIAKPPEVDCAVAADCTNEALPQCTTGGDCVECLNFSHCNNDNPLCSLSTHTCGSCRVGEEGDSICQAIDPFQPFCAESGACVECLDNSPCSIISAPICDLSSLSCRGCLSSEECDGVGDTCNLVSGVCEAP